MKDLDWIFMMEKVHDIKLFSRSIVRRLNKESDITSQQLELLSQLVIKEESMTPMTLSKEMGTSKTVISRLIDELSEKGFLIKEKDEHDKRSYFVSLTSAGRKHLDKIYKHYLEPIYSLSRKLGQEQFLELMKLIEIANEEINEGKKGDN